MHILLALICLVASGCSSLPIKEDDITRSINSITKIAAITLVHIRKLRTKLPVAPHIELMTPSIEGLTSVGRELALLDNELQSPTTDILSQIQADVSSLGGRVNVLAGALDCPSNQGQDSRGQARSEASFPDSQIYVTLTKVQLYLDKLLLDTDKLKVC